MFPTLTLSLRCKSSSSSSLFLLTLLLSAHAIFSGQIVKYLPGYDGELPFKLETGYISVGESEMFYYFIESQGNPKEDPFMFWLTGGPGCSSFSGIIYENGPLEFDIHNYGGGVPKLLYYKYTWTKTASILYLDAPVTTGFSYATASNDSSSSDSKSSQQSYEFLRKWLEEHPQYLPLQLFIGGDSYSGIIVPLITKKVVEGNEAGLTPFMNLKGYLVGSPRTDSIIDENSKIIFAHRMGLISNELYEAAKISCKEDYVHVNPSNTECVTALDAISWCVKEIWSNDILEPKCRFASGQNQDYSEGSHDQRRSLQNNPTNFLLSPPRVTESLCRNFNYVLAHIWANDAGVQEALHVRKGTVTDWQRCNLAIDYTKDILSVVDVHRYLSTKDLIALVECGDRDMVVPFVGTVNWLKDLKLNVSSEWRPWFVDGQISGYTRTYNSSSGNYYLTYATIKGAGHTAPEYKRRDCYFMFGRWIHYTPL